jgi:hypothetical protein
MLRGVNEEEGEKDHPTRISIKEKDDSVAGPKVCSRRVNSLSRETDVHREDGGWIPGKPNAGTNAGLRGGHFYKFSFWFLHPRKNISLSKTVIVVRTVID